MFLTLSVPKKHIIESMINGSYISLVKKGLGKLTSMFSAWGHEWAFVLWLVRKLLPK